jgi:hypothetical protein
MIKRLAALTIANWQSAVAGAFGALAVMIVWVAGTALFRWSEALIWIERHPSLAAWVQAILSIAAIGASSFFALWVPLHIRDLGERDGVQRAINTLLMLISTTHSAWDSTRHILEDGKWSDRSGALIRDSIARASAMADLVPASMLLGSALTAVAQCRSRLVVLNEFISRLGDSANVQQMAKQMPLRDVLEELEKTLEACSEMRPLKVAGSWMMFAPEDALDHPEIKASVRRSAP